jgi:Flp pilus assembly protein TadG
MHAMTEGRRGLRRRREGGQALTEFAIVLPVFLLLVFGVIQLGFIFGTQNGLVNGVRETARRAATYRVSELMLTAGKVNKAPLCNAVGAELTRQLSTRIPGYQSAGVRSSTVEWTWTQNPDNETWFVTAAVSVSYRHPLFIPLVGNILDRFDAEPTAGNWIMSVREEMRVENPALSSTGTPQGLACS